MSQYYKLNEDIEICTDMAKSYVTHLHNVASYTCTHVHIYSFGQALIEERVDKLIMLANNYLRTSTRKRSIYSTQKTCMLSY